MQPAWRDRLRGMAAVRLWHDPDATFVRRPARGIKTLDRRLVAALLAAFVVVAAVIAMPRPKPAAPPLAAAAPNAPHAPDFPAASEAALLATPTARLSIWRASAAPAVLVLIFPSNHAQGVTLNRIAAFVEKAGQPRKRVLNDAELNTAITDTHDDFDTYYYGHDYRAADLSRFFATAEADHISLRPEERALHDVLAEAGLLAPNTNGAVISLPPKGAGLQDDAGRHAILIHELAHGHYFTDGRYAALVGAFWRNTMTEADRAAFRRFLGSGSYDTANDDLMANEMQAYLVFTPDHRFFRPFALGLGEAEPARLRAALAAELPAGWLHDTAFAPEAVVR